MSSLKRVAKSIHTLRGVRRLSTRISSPPRSVLFVTKERDTAVADALGAVIKHIRETYPATRLLHARAASTSTSTRSVPAPHAGVEPWSPGAPAAAAARDAVDLVVTLGGDGTILRASSLFMTGPVPPMLSFSMGTLGFLLPFDIHDYREALSDVFHCRATVQQRMRLSCTFHDANGAEIGGCGPVGWQAMNEITLHRGRSPHLNVIDICVDGVHLTEAFSDGLILSTPTGSTAYSLSSGGPIVHPLVEALLLTPISPRSLSFRPLLLPGSSIVTLQINPKSRAPAEVSVDGREPSAEYAEASALHTTTTPSIGVLTAGQSVRIRASAFPIPSIRRRSLSGGGAAERTNGDDNNNESLSRSDDWVRDINTLLQFNATFRNKGKLSHSR